MSSQKLAMSIRLNSSAMGNSELVPLMPVQVWPCVEASELSLMFLGSSVNEPVVRDDVFLFQRLISQLNCSCNDDSDDVSGCVPPFSDRDKKENIVNEIHIAAS